MCEVLYLYLVQHYVNLSLTVGGFDADQISVGLVGDINMWDYEMTADEIRSLTCNDKGNLVNSSSLQIGGGVSWYEDVDLQQFIKNGLWKHKKTLKLGYNPLYDTLS
jgi:nucleoside-specific outer membrane channel protein Tsx